MLDGIATLPPPRPDATVVAVPAGLGPGLLDTVEAVWAQGGAVLPIDPDLAPPAREALLDAVRPGALLRTEPGAPARLEPLAAGEPAPAGTALVVPTSGSSGTPKGVLLSHRALQASVHAGLARLGARSGDTWLACLPPHHVAGLLVLLRARALETEPVLAPGAEPAAVAAADGTHVALVPTMLARLLDAGVDLARFRAVLLGGAPASGGLLARARAAGVRVVTSYGMTETAGGCVYDGVPLDGVDARVDEAGRIHLAGAVLADGYHRDPAGTTAAFCDGWFTTSDRGRWEGGRLVVEGRIDDAVLSGGETVDVEAVAARLAAHPQVADAAAGGVADPEWGERVVAWCVPADDGLPALADLRDHVAARLGRHAAPRQVVEVAGIPRTALGKVRRDALPAPPGPRRADRAEGR